MVAMLCSAATQKLSSNTGERMGGPSGLLSTALHKGRCINKHVSLWQNVPEHCLLYSFHCLLRMPSRRHQMALASRHRAQAGCFSSGTSCVATHNPQPKLIPDRPLLSGGQPIHMAGFLQTPWRPLGKEVYFLHCTHNAPCTFCLYTTTVTGIRRFMDAHATKWCSAFDGLTFPWQETSESRENQLWKTEGFFRICAAVIHNGTVLRSKCLLEVHPYSVQCVKRIFGTPPMISEENIFRVGLQNQHMTSYAPFLPYGSPLPFPCGFSFPNIQL